MASTSASERPLACKSKQRVAYRASVHPGGKSFGLGAAPRANGRLGLAPEEPATVEPATVKPARAEGRIGVAAAGGAAGGAAAVAGLTPTDRPPDAKGRTGPAPPFKGAIRVSSTCRGAGSSAFERGEGIAAGGEAAAGLTPTDRPPGAKGRAGPAPAFKGAIRVSSTCRGAGSSAFEGDERIGGAGIGPEALWLSDDAVKESSASRKAARTSGFASMCAPHASSSRARVAAVRRKRASVSSRSEAVVLRSVAVTQAYCSTLRTGSPC